MAVQGWILSGGLGSRMGGLNKGLQPWQGCSLLAHVIDRLTPQVATLCLNANRDVEAHRALGLPCWSDDPDLPPAQGPLNGIITGLRHADHDWLQLAPCDSPTLPLDLVARLWQAAQAHGVRVAVPGHPDATEGRPRWHWTTALVHRSVLNTLEASLRAGERRVGLALTQLPWIGVSFEDPAAFRNINTLETLHGPL